MEALTLFYQNFAVAESLVQLYQLFHGLCRSDLSQICTWQSVPIGSSPATPSSSMQATIASPCLHGLPRVSLNRSLWTEG